MVLLAQISSLLFKEKHIESDIIRTILISESFSFTNFNFKRKKTIKFIKKFITVDSIRILA